MQAPSELVIDTNVFIAGMVDPKERHSPQAQHFQEHSQAKPYIDGLKNGTYRRFHIPGLCLIEICSTVMRELKRHQYSRWLGIKKTFQQWSSDGRIVVYELDESFMNQVLNAAVKYRTRGADTVFVTLADQLSIPLKTFDGDMREKYINASRP